ncbi:SH3-like domain-containing protein [Listeria monocytogenes]
MKKGFIKGIILVIVISLFVSAFPLEGLASYRTITSEKAVGYSGKVVRSTDGIYDLGPHNTEGVTRVAMSSEYINQTIQVTEEVITDNKVTWVLISTWDGKEIGYMDKAGIEQGANFREVTNEKEVNYQAKVVRTTDGIYDFGPQNTPGVKRIGTSSQYENQSFIVSEEVVTDNEVTWVVLRDFDGHEIGWMNKNGIEKSFDYREITSESDVNYKVEITRLGDGIISKGPHHTPGADRVAFSDEYINKKFNVTNEMVTDNKVTWLLLVDDTGKQLGWIDKAGTSQISENKVVFSSNETTLPEFQTVEEIQSMDLTELPEELILEELPEKKRAIFVKKCDYRV